MEHRRRVCRSATTLVAALGLAWLSDIGPHAAGVTGPGDQQAAGRERGIYVSVVRPDGVPVTDLSNRDFVVREDGVRREVLLVERSDDPITIALVVDNSAASAPFISDVRRALKAFVKRMGGTNPIAVTAFGDRPTIVQDYTLVPAQLERAVDRLFPQPASGSYLLQALEQVSQGFQKRDFARGVIVAITAEGPEFSEMHYDQVVPVLRASGAALDAFVLSSVTPPDPASDAVRNRAAVLDLGPKATGGRRVDLLTSMALDGALSRLADQLTHEYRVVYARPETLIPPEKIEVSVTKPGLDARGTPIKPARG